jgi:hypothetical protein
MLKNFQLHTLEQVQQIKGTGRPVIYVLVFDIDGQLSKIGWTMFPSARIPSLILEQAADVKEIWLASAGFEVATSPNNREHAALRGVCRQLQASLGDRRIRNEFFRAPMRLVDDVLSGVVATA